MEDRIYLINLYDYYSDLLTEKQQLYFEDYYFNNLSLLEISEFYNISRNAVHKQLKDVEEKLKEYENILELYSKGLKLKELIKTIEDKDIKDKLESLL
jgi:predicted DNA-binding protein YlxM (UPF0122 family)